MSILGWLLATFIIVAFSAFLVFVDPFTIIADWWNERK
jgi:hypothetical protein